MPKKRKTRPLTATQLKHLLKYAEHRASALGDGNDVEVDPFPFNEHAANIHRGEDAGYFIRAWLWLPD